MSTIWALSRYGQDIDMLEPSPAKVDFNEICHILASSNRYAGNARTDVSIAYHSLMVDDLADESVRPWAILHDFHEYIIGDETYPSAQAKNAIVNSMVPYAYRDVCRRATQELKLRHDYAIFTAAGLPMPTAEQRRLIHEADIRAAVTERRDFCAYNDRAWAPEYAAAEPSPHVYVDGQFGWRPSVVANNLYRRLQKRLPCFQSNLREAA